MEEEKYTPVDLKYQLKSLDTAVVKPNQIGTFNKRDHEQFSTFQPFILAYFG